MTNPLQDHPSPTAPVDSTTSVKTPFGSAQARSITAARIGTVLSDRHEDNGTTTTRHHRDFALARPMWRAEASGTPSTDRSQPEFHALGPLTDTACNMSAIPKVVIRTTAPLRASNSWLTLLNTPESDVLLRHSILMFRPTAQMLVNKTGPSTIVEAAVTSPSNTALSEGMQ